MFKRPQGSGCTAHKDVTVKFETAPAKPARTLQTARALDPNSLLAWARNCDVFALRLRDQPPEPPKRLFKFLESTNSARFSYTPRKVVDALLMGELARIRSEILADSLWISPTTLRRRLSLDGLNYYQTILDSGRRYRCEEGLADQWAPRKRLTWDLVFAEASSFYRAFRR